jgi:hypothetical protein
MAELELGTLDPVALTKVFPKEDDDFTPWLSTHLDVLKKSTGLTLELDRKEANFGPPWGRVDILAKQVESSAAVVIENQYGTSDHDHFVRLMGYATASGADILIWVAQSFTEWHRGVLEWLNRGDVKFYAVEVSGWRIGQSSAPYFRTVVAPQWGGPSSPQSDVVRPWNANTAYAGFYQPLVQDLGTRAEIYPVGRGGWRGRYRSFKTKYEDQGIVYYLSLDETEAGQPGAWVGFQIGREYPREIYERLYARRTEIQDSMGGEEIQLWQPSDEGSNNFGFGVSLAALALTGLENNPGPTREWMFKNLVKLKEAVQPHLDQIMGELQPGDAQADEGPSPEISDGDGTGEG